MGVRNRHSGRAERGRNIAELQKNIEYDIILYTNDIAWYTIEFMIEIDFYRRNVNLRSYLPLSPYTLK